MLIHFAVCCPVKITEIVGQVTLAPPTARDARSSEAEARVAGSRHGFHTECRLYGFRVVTCGLIQSKFALVRGPASELTSQPHGARVVCFLFAFEDTPKCSYEAGEAHATNT